MMKTLYHYPLCPFSRQIRIGVKELNCPANLIKEDFWLRRPEFIRLSHSGELPVLTEISGVVIQGVHPIMEYLNETTKACKLMDANPVMNAEIRRLVYWFNCKFYREVSKWIIDEKLIRLVSRAGMPRTEFIRAAKSNLIPHMQYIAKLLKTRSYIAHEKISFADIAAAAHISCMDYFGEIAWDQYDEVREWYALIKSRPSFKDILQDHLPGFPPPKYYQDLDF